MSTTSALVEALKQELRSSGITYGALAKSLGMAESSVKRMFANSDTGMSLRRVDEICGVLNLDFADLSAKVATTKTLRTHLTLEQEKAVVKSPKLLLMAICVLSQWELPQILEGYRFTESEAVGLLVELDRLGVIVLRANNAYSAKIGKTFRWRADGPVMDFFRSDVIGDYYAGGFDGDDEALMLVHGEVGVSNAAAFAQRLQEVGQEFAAQHYADRQLPASQKRAYTVIVGMRGWLFAPFRDLQRSPKPKT